MRKERFYTCTECQRSFTRTNTLANHKRTHTGEKPFACTSCDRVFRNEGNLKIHMRTHTGERPFKCTYCEKRFSQHGSLKAHIRIHTKERPFICEICTKTFRVQNNLKKHMVVHSKELSFSCEHCNKGFKLRSDLKRHIKNVHGSNITATTLDSNNVTTDDSSSSNVLSYMMNQCEIKQFSYLDSHLQPLETNTKVEQNLQGYGSDFLNYAMDQSSIKILSNLDTSALQLNENLIKEEQSSLCEESLINSYNSLSQFYLNQPSVGFSMISPIDINYINIEPQQQVTSPSYYIPLSTVNMEELKSFTDLTNLQ